MAIDPSPRINFQTQFWKDEAAQTANLVLLEGKPPKVTLLTLLSARATPEFNPSFAKLANPAKFETQVGSVSNRG